MRFILPGLLAACISLIPAMSLSARAQTITYTGQTIASGTLGTTSFTDQNLVLTFTGTVASVTGGGGFFSIQTPGTVTITGLGTATLTSAGADVYDNQGAIFNTTQGIAGFGDISQGATLLGTFNDAFATYDLTSAIGPLSGSSFFRSDITFATTAGGLNLSAVGDSTFTASFSAVNPVPEPSEWLAMAMASASVGGLMVRARRRRAAAAGTTETAAA